MSDLTLYQLPPSPNSIKPRLALALKGVPHRRVDIDPMDRSLLVKVSGQPLAPVLVHGDRVVYDSYAILRYLDANWPAPPRLYAAEREAQQEIEGWELFARVQLGEVIGMVFNQAFAPEADPAALRRANELLGERAQRLEDALADGREHLMGARPNAADLTAAPFVSYGLLGEPSAEAVPIRAFFARHLRLPARFERTRAWAERVMAIEACAGPAR